MTDSSSLKCLLNNIPPPCLSHLVDPSENIFFQKCWIWWRGRDVFHLQQDISQHILLEHIFDVNTSVHKKHHQCDHIMNIWDLFGFNIACLFLAKAGHESRLPAAHYRYTHGKTRGYGNSRVWVTCDHRSTRIWVRVLGAASTCHRYLSDIVFLYFIFCAVKIMYIN